MCDNSEIIKNCAKSNLGSIGNIVSRKRRALGNNNIREGRINFDSLVTSSQRSSSNYTVESGPQSNAAGPTYCENAASMDLEMRLGETVTERTSWLSEDLKTDAGVASRADYLTTNRFTCNLAIENRFRSILNDHRNNVKYCNNTENPKKNENSFGPGFWLNNDSSSNSETEQECSPAEGRNSTYLKLWNARGIRMLFQANAFTSEKGGGRCKSDSQCTKTSRSDNFGHINASNAQSDFQYSTLWASSIFFLWGFPKSVRSTWAEKIVWQHGGSYGFGRKGVVHFSQLMQNLEWFFSCSDAENNRTSENGRDETYHETDFNTASSNSPRGWTIKHVCFWKKGLQNFEQFISDILQSNSDNIINGDDSFLVKHVLSSQCLYTPLWAALSVHDLKVYSPEANGFFRPNLNFEIDLRSSNFSGPRSSETECHVDKSDSIEFVEESTNRRFANPMAQQCRVNSDSRFKFSGLRLMPIGLRKTKVDASNRQTRSSRDAKLWKHILSNILGCKIMNPILSKAEDGVIPTHAVMFMASKNSSIRDSTNSKMNCQPAYRKMIDDIVSLGIPIVNQLWVETCYQRGAVAEVHPYFVGVQNTTLFGVDFETDKTWHKIEESDTSFSNGRQIRNDLLRRTVIITSPSFVLQNPDLLNLVLEMGAEIVIATTSLYDLLCPELSILKGQMIMDILQSHDLTNRGIDDSDMSKFNIEYAALESKNSSFDGMDNLCHRKLSLRNGETQGWTSMDDSVIREMLRMSPNIDVANMIQLQCRIQAIPSDDNFSQYIKFLTDTREEIKNCLIADYPLEPCQLDVGYSFSDNAFSCVLLIDPYSEIEGIQSAVEYMLMGVDEGDVDNGYGRPQQKWAIDEALSNNKKMAAFAEITLFRSLYNEVHFATAEWVKQGNESGLMDWCRHWALGQDLEPLSFHRRARDHILPGVVVEKLQNLEETVKIATSIAAASDSLSAAAMYGSREGKSTDLDNYSQDLDSSQMPNYMDAEYKWDCLDDLMSNGRRPSKDTLKETVRRYLLQMVQDSQRLSAQEHRGEKYPR